MNHEKIGASQTPQRTHTKDKPRRRQQGGETERARRSQAQKTATQGESHAASGKPDANTEAKASRDGGNH